MYERFVLVMQVRPNHTSYYECAKPDMEYRCQILVIHEQRHEYEHAPNHTQWHQE